MEKTDITPITKTDEERRASLTPEQYEILRKAGTERAFTGPYVSEKTPGMYNGAGCGPPLFASDAKFDSGTGWPSFTDPAVAEAVETRTDRKFGMVRTEVVCRRCGGHLGHVFPDGPGASGQRYCIHGCAPEVAAAR